MSLELHASLGSPVLRLMKFEQTVARQNQISKGVLQIVLTSAPFTTENVRNVQAFLSYEIYEGFFSYKFKT
jgi:hypothetical protein